MEFPVPQSVSTPTRRKAYTNRDKLKVMDLAEKEGNRSAARAFAIDEANIRRWRKRKAEILVENLNKKTRRHKTCKNERLESELYQWVLEIRSKKARVTGTQIQFQARYLAKLKGIEDFNASNGWLDRFKRRRNLSTRFNNSIGQPLPADHLEKMELFRHFVQQKKDSNNILPENIVNMDEVPMAFDMPGTRTIDVKGTEDVAINTTGHERSNFTVVLAVSASGAKLKPMIIFKRKTMPKEVFPEGVVVSVNQKGWMNADMMGIWLEKCWKTRPDCFFKKPNSRNCLLIYDACPAHLTAEVKEKVKLNAELAVIPGGLTKFLQPLDISVNKSFKNFIRHEWEKWLLDDSSVELTKSGKRKRASLSAVCNWIAKAWKNVPASAIKNGFRRAGIQTYNPENIESDADIIEGQNESELNVLPEIDENMENLLLHDSENQSQIELDEEESLLGDDFDGFED